GQKDYQQCKVIARLIELTGKQKEVKLKIVPTSREKDGLAMSSRNLRLSAAQRIQAPALFESLMFVKKNFLKKPSTVLKEEAYQQLESKGFNVDYFEIADAVTLESSTDSHAPLVALVAASIGKIRLIDNLLLN
ncbi:MAG TPA: pantoate--beta-alanine ligase, partial [Flavisolibacter sp.]|nr:pantoate--beta-alanine ligase [Flavisolibacter sp.]